MILGKSTTALSRQNKVGGDGIGTLMHQLHKSMLTVSALLPKYYGCGWPSQGLAIVGN